MISPDLVSKRRAEDERVVSALRFAGVTVGSVFDLVNSREKYPGALPTLVSLLPTVTDPWIKEGVVRALAVPEARACAGAALLREFKAIGFEGDADPSSQALKWAIGNSLAIAADESLREDLIGIAREKRHGKAREMIVVALGRLKGAGIDAVLVELLEDNDTAAFALQALRRRRAHAAIPAIRQLLQREGFAFRPEAEKTIRALEKASPPVA